ncbi:archaetidylserine decarboxylase [uncultured Halovibrio sp.]|uniref:archaetidylserine decarboxylase n=1 Tax=uncultured Halovibrio sp. TaxID=985049 RepID=UPI0025E72894|nr:archaetidylserine decarboxylase [uncultured Halovibrio sp.]
MMHSLLDSGFIAAQHLAPQHGLSRLAGRVADSRHPALRRRLINGFIRRYGVDMNEAADPDPEAYASFNDFFTRPLRDDARPIEGDERTLVCPADGAISQSGTISRGRLFQAKGQSFSAAELTARPEPELAAFEQGRFATIYLSPKDYHRVHMPVTGTLEATTTIPGRLFSVNPATTRNVPRLFARNERLVAWFRTEYGPMAVVMVGAMIVAGIETVWGGRVAPGARSIRHAAHDGPHLARGAEMGRFYLGSTVILMLPRGAFEPTGELNPEQSVRMGESLFRAS